MINELFYLGGYGQFVWTAFTFTFLICWFLYLKTKKELVKSEQLFLAEFNEMRFIKNKTNQGKEILIVNRTSKSF
tara:strand:- start:279 stop:503 length:225 start_codon:yes stop_codon:yes gene_type:complete